ncbi:hypothetical protein BJY01DRAFT_76263 [Aspergillus pseudoustus]|uniref:Uncharacterized protein n=1 Tax=Aspergillus pseudoustus TaxID=1810923 RepID=A0ABR4J931_9EURO
MQSRYFAFSFSGSRSPYFILILSPYFLDLSSQHSKSTLAVHVPIPLPLYHWCFWRLISFTFARHKLLPTYTCLFPCGVNWAIHTANQSKSGAAMVLLLFLY